MKSYTLSNWDGRNSQSEEQKYRQPQDATSMITDVEQHSKHTRPIKTTVENILDFELASTRKEDTAGIPYNPTMDAAVGVPRIGRVEGSSLSPALTFVERGKSIQENATMSALAMKPVPPIFLPAINTPPHTRATPAELPSLASSSTEGSYQLESRRPLVSGVVSLHTTEMEVDLGRRPMNARHIQTPPGSKESRTSSEKDRRTPHSSPLFTPVSSSPPYVGSLFTPPASPSSLPPKRTKLVFSHVSIPPLPPGKSKVHYKSITPGPRPGKVMRAAAVQAYEGIGEALQASFAYNDELGIIPTFPSVKKKKPRVSKRTTALPTALISSLGPPPSQIRGSKKRHLESSSKTPLFKRPRTISASASQANGQPPINPCHRNVESVETVRVFIDEFYSNSADIHASNLRHLVGNFATRRRQLWGSGYGTKNMLDAWLRWPLPHPPLPSDKPFSTGGIVTGSDEDYMEPPSDEDFPPKEATMSISTDPSISRPTSVQRPIKIDFVAEYRKRQEAKQRAQKGLLHSAKMVASSTSKPSRSPAKPISSSISNPSPTTLSAKALGKRKAVSPSPHPSTPAPMPVESTENLPTTPNPYTQVTQLSPLIAQPAPNTASYRTNIFKDITSSFVDNPLSIREEQTGVTGPFLTQSDADVLDELRYSAPSSYSAWGELRKEEETQYAFDTVDPTLLFGGERTFFEQELPSQLNSLPTSPAPADPITLIASPTTSSRSSLLSNSNSTCPSISDAMEITKAASLNDDKEASYKESFEEFILVSPPRALVTPQSPAMPPIEVIDIDSASDYQASLSSSAMSVASDAGRPQRKRILTAKAKASIRLGWKSTVQLDSSDESDSCYGGSTKVKSSPKRPVSRRKVVPKPDDAVSSEQGEELLDQGVSQPKPQKRRNGSWPTCSTETYCHQCRNKTFFLKRKCQLCTKVFCVKCLTLRYSDRQFQYEGPQPSCPACDEYCNCTACARKRGEVYVSTARKSQPRLSDGQTWARTNPGRVTLGGKTNLPPSTAPVPTSAVAWGTLYHLDGKLLGAGYSAPGKDGILYSNSSAPLDKQAVSLQQTGEPLAIIKEKPDKPKPKRKVKFIGRVQRSWGVKVKKTKPQRFKHAYIGNPAFLRYEVTSIPARNPLLDDWGSLSPLSTIDSETDDVEAFDLNQPNFSPGQLEDRDISRAISLGLDAYNRSVSTPSILVDCASLDLDDPKPSLPLPA